MLNFLQKTPATANYAVGFPKTGNTWFRFLLGRYVQLLAGSNEIPLLEDCAFDHSLFKAVKAAPVVATHRPLTWDTQTAEDLKSVDVLAVIKQSKVILLVRHPLDACLSHYMHVKHRTNLRQVTNFTAFCNDPVFGLEKFLRFYEIWAEMLNSPRVHLVRYEDMKRDTHAVLSSALSFLGIRADIGIVKSAVEFASFENMRQLETQVPQIKYRSSGFPVFGKRDPSNNDSRHIRQGSVGAYASHLNEDQIAKLEIVIGDRLPRSYSY